MTAPDREELREANTFSRRFSLLYNRGIVVPVLAGVLVSIVVSLVTLWSFSSERVAEVAMKEALQRTIQILIVSEQATVENALASHKIIQEMADRLPESKEKSAILEASNSAQKSLSVLDENIKKIQDYLRLIDAGALSTDFGLISRALAEEPNVDLKKQLDEAKIQDEIMKTKVRFWGYIGILCALLVVLIGSIVALFVTTDDKRFAAALDIMKLLIGFFIGVMSSFFGLPAGA